MTTTDLQTRLQHIATQSGKSLIEVQAAFNEALKSIPPGTTDSKKNSLALKLTHKNLTGGSKSQAISFEAVIFGADRTRDMMESIRKNAITQYSQNPQLAVESGLVRVEGDKIVVLNNLKEFNGKPNPNYGKPRPEHLHTRDLIIVARKPGEQQWIPGRLQLRGDQCSLAVPIGKFVEFRALGEKVNGQYKLRSSVVTQFTPKSEIPTEEQIRILETAFATNVKELGEGITYHKSLLGKPGFYDRLLIATGVVKYIKFASDPSKNHMVVLSDDSLGKDEGVTVWVPNNLRSLINFGRDSIVTIVGQTSIGAGWDFEKKVPLPNVERLMINAYSIFGQPGLTTIVEEQGPDLL